MSNMKSGTKHRQFGGGLGGTLAGRVGEGTPSSIRSAYASKAQMAEEQVKFLRIRFAHRLSDGDVRLRWLGSTK